MTKTKLVIKISLVTLIDQKAHGPEDNAIQNFFLFAVFPWF